jgi:Protein of unknown function (DUF3108)
MMYPLAPSLFLISSAALFVLAAAPLDSPAFENEQLHYNLNWPSGVTLGEASMSASSSTSGAETARQLHFQFSLDGGIPGFSIADRYRSEASPEFCSTEFSKAIEHGRKKTDEKTTFDPHDGSATRQTAGGGSSELTASSCSRDALTFLYYVRHELSEGRLPGPETVFWGAPYQVRLNLAGTQTIRIANKPVNADRVTASVKGPASSLTFDIFFLEDQTRTPALVRVPLALGTFSMELVK